MSAIFTLKDVSLYYGKTAILKNVNLSFLKEKVTCIIGPSGAGKSTLLRTLNRMNDLIPTFHCRGEVLFEDKDIYNNGIEVNLLRQDVGMVFQKPCIFPKSIYENVLFGAANIHNKRKSEFPLIVEETLKAVSLWSEVKNKLHCSALELSQGQQQRISIARALSVGPKVLLVDEPTSSLDHKSASAIEELVRRLSSKLTIIMVTHKLDQAKRIADDVVFMCDEKICESGRADQFFKEPQKIETKCYINHESYNESMRLH